MFFGNPYLCVRTVLTWARARGGESSMLQQYQYGMHTVVVMSEWLVKKKRRRSVRTMYYVGKEEKGLLRVMKRNVQRIILNGSVMGDGW